MNRLIKAFRGDDLIPREDALDLVRDRIEAWTIGNEGDEESPYHEGGLLALHSVKHALKWLNVELEQTED